MAYEYVEDAEPQPAPPPPPPPAASAAAWAAASAATSQHSNVPSQSGHGRQPSPRSSAAHPPPPPPPPLPAISAPRPPPPPSYHPPTPRPPPPSLPRPSPPPPPPSLPRPSPPHPPSHHPPPLPVPQPPQHVLQQQPQPPLLQQLKHPTAPVGFNDYFTPAPGGTRPADSGGVPVPVAPPPTHPRPSKEALLNDYFTATPAAAPVPARAATAIGTPAMTPSSPSVENLPLPGADLPERGKSANSSIHGPSAVVDEKKTDGSIMYKRPSMWTQAQAPLRKDADCRLKPQKDANWPLVSSEPSSNNQVKEEEEPTDNKDEKKKAKEKEKEKREALAEIKRKANERALKNEPGSIEDTSWENGRMMKEPSKQCVLLVTLGIIATVVLFGIGIVFTLAFTGVIHF